MAKMECSDVVGKEIPSMQKCLNLIPQLSSRELVDLAEAVEKEKKTRKTAKCKEKLLAAMNAFSELYDYYCYLEIEHEGVLMNIYLTDISEALEQLYEDC